MPVESSISANFLDAQVTAFLLKGLILILLIFYAFFAILIVRQVNLMARTLITKISTIVGALALGHAVFAVGMIFLTWLIL